MNYIQFFDFFKTGKDNQLTLILCEKNRRKK